MTARTPIQPITTSGLVVPAYFHPALADADWETLARSAPAVRMVVLNVASGPGEAPDPAFVAAVSRLRATGIAVAGYVDTDYGHREHRPVLAEISAYQRWYGADSVFFDRVASGIEHAPHYEVLAAAARQLGAVQVAFNHGTYPDRDYADYADLLGTFEGTWADFPQVYVPSWVHDHPAATFFNLLYDTPARMARAVATLAAERNVGSVYRTELGGANPWSRLPADFPGPAVR